MSAEPICQNTQTTRLKIWVPPLDTASGESGSTASGEAPSSVPAKANAATFTAEQVAALMAAMGPAAVWTPPPVSDQMILNHVVKTASCRTIADVIKPYFDWAAKERAPNSIARMRLSWQQYASSLPSADWLEVSVASAYAWAATHSHWSANTRAGRLTDLTTVCNWLVRARLISENPMSGLQKPPRESRKKYVTFELHRRILHIVKDAMFRALLRLAWETGGRPQELRPLEARHVQFAQKRVFIPADEAKGARGQKRARKIYLTARAIRLLKVLCHLRPTGPLFVSKNSEPLTSNALAHRFAKIRSKLGADGQGIVFTCYRHGFATRLLEGSESNSTVAELMGHTTTVMVDRVYSHLGAVDTHLVEAVSRNESQGGTRLRRRTQ